MYQSKDIFNFFILFNLMLVSYSGSGQLQQPGLVCKQFEKFIKIKQTMYFDNLYLPQT